MGQKSVRGVVKGPPTFPRDTQSGKTMTTFIVYSQDKNGGELIEVIVLQDGDSHLVDEVYEKIKEGDFVVLTGSRNDEGTYFLRAFAKDTNRDAAFFCGFRTEKEYKEFHRKIAEEKKAQGFVLATSLDGERFWERKVDCRYFNNKWYPLVDYLGLMLGEGLVAQCFREFAKRGMQVRGGLRFDQDGYKKLLAELEAKILF